MPQLTIAINLQGKSAVVVGGGKVATRKCLPLIRCKAKVTVIAPSLAACLQRLVRYGMVNYLAKGYSEGDLAGAAVAFAATDRPETNRQVAREAEASGIPVNVTDAPELSSFNSPAVVRRGDLTIAVTTNGKAPALSRKIRKQLATTYGREYAETAALMGKVREKLLTQNDNHRYNKQILSSLANSPIPELFRNGLLREVEHLLLELCGPGFTLNDLGMRKETTT
ncbi:bifunctional precorrin-2 dehydrogenase/sirohydrochlorin ferrochelatase [Geobacter pelophilus]|uniref:precorrin-2 dehydrogenase n=1 Tax=Geoanaerobacter pelophilus TaxID=60036 RepID=A0AAW4L8A8_9BACT|nr:bifunctional precorrin-2 dehydrogenase/sirohydrochlorin ferrochelatase [Geoanaerobacter pelophilus]MBT0664057.1 bifunctional precorrin-2 dehydrogenase/sirohydrochlorin ferrochelatase [Geoanaerobacter pelophilus]